MLRALKRTVETIVADLRELGPLPMPIDYNIQRIEWAVMTRNAWVLWDCVAELDRVAGVADVQGYYGVAERYRKASRNLKPAIVNYEASNV
jgi:hypothetical protein